MGKKTKAELEEELARANQKISVLENHFLHTTEDELRVSEEKYRLLAENISDVVWVLDTANMTFKYVSPSVKKLRGYTVEEALSQRFEEQMAPESFKTIMAKYPKRMENFLANDSSAVTKVDEILQPCKDGSTVWTEVVSTFVRNKDGGLDILGVSRDISKRKRAERTLRENEAHLQSFFENAGSLIWIKDMEGRFVSINRLTETALGIPREQIIGRTVHDIFPQIEANPYRENDQLVLKTGRIIEFEETAILNGVSHSYSSTKFPLRDSHGMIYALGAICTDTTERKQVETALRESEEKYRNLAGELEQHVIERTNEIQSVQRRLEVATRAAELGIWDWNIVTNQLVFDEQMHAIYGTTPETFNETIEGFIKIVHPEDANNLMALAQAVLNGDPHYHVQYRIIREDRSVRHIKAYGTVLHDTRNKAEHVIGVVMDITQDKESEETLRLANLELERAMRVKDEFLANMSHELRTPLNSILGISESLEEQVAGQINEKQGKYLRIISESGHHLLNLINDILDLSKIGAGRLELSLSQFSAEALCQSSMRMIKELAQKKQLTVSCKLDDKVKTIYGDERRLKQILVNLLSNAVKFTPEGESVGLEIIGNVEENQINICVWDNGIGISEHDLSRLFKPFVQLDNRFSREAGGTGLGLMLVSQLARLHGGNVSVQSQLNKGSRFMISLPWHIGQVDEPGTELDDNSNLLEANLPQQSLTAKILLVEDMESIILYMQDYLESKGHKVTVARNGHEGAVFAKNLLPDIILMDIQMPSMDGFEATRWIRAEASLKNTPIIALTALAMPGDREKCIQAGMNSYLSKPIDLKELNRLLNQYIEHKGAQLEQ